MIAFDPILPAVSSSYVTASGIPSSRETALDCPPYFVFARLFPATRTVTLTQFTRYVDSFVFHSCRVGLYMRSLRTHSMTTTIKPQTSTVQGLRFTL